MHAIAHSNVIALSAVALSAVAPYSETEDAAPDAAQAEPDAPAETVPAEPVNVTVQRAAVAAALDIVANVADKRNTIPILGNVKLAATSGVMILSATDLDMEISVLVPTESEGEFETTAPAHLLSKLFKAGDSDVAEFRVGEEKAAVAFGRTTYALQTLPAADYPALNAGEFPDRFTMTGKQFWDMLDGTLPSVSTEETRYYLNGIFIHCPEPGGALRFVATDGHRLARMECPAPESVRPGIGGGVAGNYGSPGAILPRQVAALLHKLLKGKRCPDHVTLEISATKFRIAFDNVELVSKLVDGTFPDYQRVIPTGNDKPGVFDSEAFAKAVKAASLISNQRGGSFKLSLADGEAHITVNDPDAGSAVSVMPCGYTSEPMEIGFNPDYVLQLLGDASPDGGPVTGMFSDSGSPTLFTGTREGWLGVLMPKRV